jgi:hypothetical protein
MKLICIEGLAKFKYYQVHGLSITNKHFLNVLGDGNKKKKEKIICMSLY